MDTWSKAAKDPRKVTCTKKYAGNKKTYGIRKNFRNQIRALGKNWCKLTYRERVQKRKLDIRSPEERAAINQTKKQNYKKPMKTSVPKGEKECAEGVGGKG